MSEERVIPIFPLSIVVFPGQSVPLHIFEERYKAMVADCSPAGPGEPFRPFGISLQMGGAVEAVGCTVAVSQIAERYADGSFDIVTQAQSRYTTRQTYDDRPYLTGRVELFDDLEGGRADPSLAREVGELFRQLLALAAEEAGVEAAQVSSPPAAELDAYTVASRAGLALRQKQRLLEMRREADRLEQLLAFLGEAIPRSRLRLDRKRRAKSNGRSREA